MYKQRNNEKAITLIALVVTIVVLLILAGVSISMLTGENGIITQAQNSKEQNEIGKEKEYINLAFTAIKGTKIANGDMSDVTSAELQEEINNYTNEATVTGTGILKITYTSGREYEVDGNGNITSSKSYDGMYSVGGLEGQIAPQDLFEYEIIDKQAKTVRIVRIKPEYFNLSGYNPRTSTYDLTNTNGDIIYNGQTISDMLVIPYEMEQNGVKYTITEANVMAENVEYIGSGTWEIYGVYPNVDNLIYPNSITAITTPLNLYSSGDDWQEFNAEGLKSIVLSENLKEIPEMAFFNGINLTSITIPDSVTSIGSYAFSWCENLTNITIPDSVTYIGREAFRGTGWYNNQPDGNVYIGKIYYEYKGEMPENTNIIIKEGTTSITDEAFYECENLTNITIPDSVTSIGDNAFYYCENLINITIPDSVTSVGYRAFYRTPWYESQPNGEVYVGKIYYEYIGEMPANTSIIIKEGTTQIAPEAFSYCYSLASITIPDSVTSIGEYAFEGCSSLTSITIPESVTSIGKVAFSGCSSLTSITIPDSITSIREWTFGGCSSLTNIKIPDSVINIGALAFTNCTSLTNITIPDGVRNIRNDTFYECENLTNITIPDSVTSIGGNAFAGCSNLTSIIIPNSVKIIGYNAFYECEKLTSINIKKEQDSLYDSPWGAYNATINWNYTGE